MTGSTFFQAVDQWLKNKGFYAHMAREGTVDGHSLRKSLADVRSSGCASDGCCSTMYVQKVLNQLKEVPGWTENQSRSSLEAAGFNPDSFELR